VRAACIALYLGVLVVAPVLRSVDTFSGIIHVGTRRQEVRTIFEFIIMRKLAVSSPMRLTGTSSQPFMALGGVTVHRSRCDFLVSR